MNQTRAGTYLIILIIAFFGLLFSQTSKPTQQPTPTSQPIAQKPSDEQGKVLSGGCGSDAFIDIKNNNVSPTSVNATYSSKLNKYLVCFLNYDLSQRIVVADDNSWSTTLFAAIECGNGTCPTNPSEPQFDKGTYKYHLQSNANAKGTIYAGTSSSTSTTSDSTDTATTTTPTTTTTEPEEKTIKDVVLPSVFRAKGSKSTNLSKISDPKKVKNFTIDVVGKNRVVFTDLVDLSSTKSPSLFKSLDKYVQMVSLGVVEVDTKTLSMLAKKRAAVSMFGLPFVATPKILVDGKVDSAGVVSNVKYAAGTLTFDVKNFSKFEAVPTLTINQPQTGFEVADPDITLTGKITDPAANVSAKLNNRSLGNLKVATSSGQFSGQLTLKEGNNTIQVSALSKFGPPLVATVSGVFTPKVITAQMIVVAGLMLLVIALIGAWWYIRRRQKTTREKSTT